MDSPVSGTRGGSGSSPTSAGQASAGSPPPQLQSPKLGKSAGNLLARLNFPPYTIRVLTERHFLVAGGGGMAKTGIKNSIEVYELVHSPSEDSGKSIKKIPNSVIGSCKAQLVAHFDTGLTAPMSSCIFIPTEDKNGQPWSSGSLMLATGGMGGECTLYKLSLTTTNHDPDEVFSSHKSSASKQAQLVRTASMSNGDCDGVPEGLRRRRTSSACSDYGDDGTPVPGTPSKGMPTLKAIDSEIEDNLHVPHKPKHERKPSKPGNGTVLQNGGVSNGSIPNGTSHMKNANEEQYPVPNVIFKIEPVKQFIADLGQVEEDRFLKVIRYSRQLGLLVTGGADGKIRIWKYPRTDGHLLHTLDAHKDEVDDLDIDPLTGDTIVSSSRDGHAHVWSAKSGKQLTELRALAWQQNGVRYVTRAVRFGLVPKGASDGGPANGLPRQRKLYTIMNPTVRTNPPKPAYLVRWNPEGWVPEDYARIDGALLSSLTVSDDGRYLGVGSMDGAVSIFITYSLKRLYHNPTAHNIFCTGLEFLATTPTTQLLTGEQDTSLVSVSVDNHIVAHHVPKPVTIDFLGSMTVFILLMMLIYYVMDFIGL